MGGTRVHLKHYEGAGKDQGKEAGMHQRLQAQELESGSQAAAKLVTVCTPHAAVGRVHGQARLQQQRRQQRYRPHLLLEPAGLLMVLQLELVKLLQQRAVLQFERLCG